MQNWKKTCALLILQGTVILPSFSENLELELPIPLITRGIEFLKFPPKRKGSEFSHKKEEAGKKGGIIN